MSLDIAIRNAGSTRPCAVTDGSKLLVTQLVDGVLIDSAKPKDYCVQGSQTDKEIHMRMQLCSTLLIALTLFCSPLRAIPQSDSSQKDKAKKCEETAKNRGLKGDEKATYVSSCMAAKETADSAASNASPQEKQKADNAQSCEQQATQKGLKGKDRRDFMKTCSTAAPAAPK